MQVVKQVFRAPANVLSSEVYDVLLRGELGYPSASPIFVVGMPRSGSTLVEQILSSHPEACGAGKAAPCCTVPCCAMLCRAVPCCAVLCCAVLCCAVLCGAMLVLCCAMLVLCCAVPCRAMPCCAVLLCCAVLCRAVPCRAIPFFKVSSRAT